MIVPLKRHVHEAISAIEELHGCSGFNADPPIKNRRRWKPSALETPDLSEPLSAAGAHGSVLHAALRQRRRVGCFTPAASARRFTLHLLLNWSGVDVQKVGKGVLRESDFPLLTQAAGQLAGAPILIDDTPAAGAWHIVTQAERWRAGDGLDLVVVDYAGRTAGPAASDASLFMEFAHRTGVPVMLFHQTATPD